VKIINVNVKNVSSTKIRLLIGGFLIIGFSSRSVAQLGHTDWTIFESGLEGMRAQAAAQRAAQKEADRQAARHAAASKAASAQEAAKRAAAQRAAVQKAALNQIDKALNASGSFMLGGGGNGQPRGVPKIGADDFILEGSLGGTIGGATAIQNNVPGPLEADLMQGAAGVAGGQSINRVKVGSDGYVIEDTLGASSSTSGTGATGSAPPASKTQLGEAIGGPRDQPQNDGGGGGSGFNGNTVPGKIPSEGGTTNSGIVGNGTRTPGDVAEDRANALEARQSAADQQKRSNLALDVAEKLNDAAREKFQDRKFDDWREHPDIKGAPLSKAEIREARQRVFNGQALDPATGAKLDQIIRELQKPSKIHGLSLEQALRQRPDHRVLTGEEARRFLEKLRDRGVPSDSLLNLNGP
jgi:hypothetical protein